MAEIKSPPSDAKAFIVEMLNRFRTKNPFFFNVLAWGAFIVEVLNEFTLFILTLDLDLPDGARLAIRCVTITTLIMAHLTTQRKVITPGAAVTPAQEEKMPFTAKKEAEKVISDAETG